MQLSTANNYGPMPYKQETIEMLASDWTICFRPLLIKPVIPCIDGKLIRSLEWPRAASRRKERVGGRGGGG